MTITLDYQVEFNGLLMGNDTPYDIVALIGAGFPSIRSGDINRQDDHGTYPSARELLQARTMNLEINIIGTTMVDLSDKVRAFKSAVIPSEDIRPLLFRFPAAGWGGNYAETVQTNGYVRQLTANIGDDANMSTQKVYLQFECPDPRVYSFIEHSLFAGPNEVAGGWTFPWTFPWTFSDVISTGQLEVVNTGNIDSPPEMFFHGPATNPRVENLNTGEFLELTMTIDAGDYVHLNFREKTALLNGFADRWNFRRFGSTWFPIRPGSNALQYSLAFGLGQFELRWRDAWL